MKISSYIDKVSELIGKQVAWFIPVIMIIVVYDIALRALGGATKWAYEVSWMLNGTTFLMAGAYVLRHKAHIRIDFFYKRFSERQRAIIDLISYLVLFFPVVVIVLKYGIPYVIKSWVIEERSPFTFGTMPVYPVKTVIPVAFLLLGLQGLVEFLRTLAHIIKARTS